MNARTTWSSFGVRCVLSALTLATTGAMGYGFMGAVGGDGVHVLDWVMTILFVLLTLWVSFSFWAATLGLVVRVLAPVRSKPAEADHRYDLPLTAILVPVYNEDPATVFAGITATCESLLETGRADRFEVFVLSDTRDANVWAAEQRAWRYVADRFAGRIAIHYRRRVDNRAKKAGNVAEFCRRWGGRYEHMIVFDADSVMTGSTMLEMVRRMEADPELGILQVPPQPVLGESLLARVQQFAASLYGDVFAGGLQLWTGVDGNYWGHNAIIRVAPFIEHCDLPELPGRAPFGGPIFSHDFIEAALMRRARWKVRLATDLRGSYEQCPTNLIDYAQRDQRWCQGNLQHANILIRRRLRYVSRMHLLTGIMSYVSAPLLVAFLMIGIAQMALRNAEIIGPGDTFDGWPTVADPSATGVALFVITMLMLLLPKLWSIFTLDTAEARRLGHGDHGNAVASAAYEVILSILIAPIMLAYHTTFVIAGLLGKTVSWNNQERSARGVAWRTAFRAHWRQTVVGIALMLFTAKFTPQLFWWVMPIGLGLSVSIPLSRLLGSVAAGRWALDCGLFLIPEEHAPPRLLRRVAEAEHELAATLGPIHDDDWLRLLVDPVGYAVHLNVLNDGAAASDGPIPSPPADIAAARVTDPADRFAILRSVEAAKQWRRWLWQTLSPPEHAAWAAAR